MKFGRQFPSSRCCLIKRMCAIEPNLAESNRWNARNRCMTEMIAMLNVNVLAKEQEVWKCNITKYKTGRDNWQRDSSGSCCVFLSRTHRHRYKEERSRKRQQENIYLCKKKIVAHSVSDYNPTVTHPPPPKKITSELPWYWLLCNAYPIK